MAGVLCEAAEWLQRQNMPMWRADELVADRSASDVPAESFFVAECPALRGLFEWWSSYRQHVVNGLRPGAGQLEKGGLSCGRWQSVALQVEAGEDLSSQGLLSAVASLGHQSTYGRWLPDICSLICVDVEVAF